MTNILLIVEPWACHFEVFPSVINSSIDQYDGIYIFVQDPTRLKEIINEDEICSIKKVQLKSISSLVENIQRLKATNIDFDIWSNTTHIHGNYKSFEVFQHLYKSTIDRGYRGRIFTVIHNKHDYEFTERLRLESPKDQVIPIFLSKDTEYRYMAGKQHGKLFEPYTLKLKTSKTSNESIYNLDDPIRLLIIGMCREGKKFNQLYLFKDFIKKNKVQISYCGWSPSESIRESGLLSAVKEGLITNIACSPNRVDDNVFNKMIEQAHAIIDLKIVKEYGYVSSGNIGASVAMRKPLIAHTSNYPSFNCLRFKDYDDLREILIKKEKLIEGLKFQEFLLQKEYESRLFDCAEVFR